MSQGEERRLRHAFGTFMTGVTVVTTQSPEGRPLGFTANSFTSVSLEPPLLLVCLARKSRALEVFTSAPGFTVNVLADDQMDISNTFARPQEDRFIAVNWATGPTGAPIIHGVAAWFACWRHEMVEAGDHVIIIGLIQDFRATDRLGLGYFRGRYFRHDPNAATDHPRTLVGAIIEGGGGVFMLRDGVNWKIPRTVMMGGEGSVSCLHRLLESLGLLVQLEFPYSVWEDDSEQHLIYRCEAMDPKPARGRFCNLSQIDPQEFEEADRAMLARFQKEHLSGQFSVYFGGAKAGTVRRLSET